MYKFLLLVFSVVFCVANTGEIVGVVNGVKGIVKVKSQNSIKKTKVKAGYMIKSGDLIVTSSNAFAKLKLKDKSQIVLDKSSSIFFNSVYNVKQKDGKVYYKITSRDAKNSLKIKTPFAIIGIKGTTFIVNATNNASVALKEGLIGVESIKEEFELYRKKTQKQFEDFMAKQQSAYELYKQVQEPGFAEKTKEFDLQERTTVVFDKNKVKEKAWTKEDDEEFEYFEKLMSAMK